MEAPEGRKPGRDALALGALFALAAAAREFAIGRESLWLDEAYTARIARLPWDAMLREAWSDVHPPLFTILLHVWSAAFGAGEGALRGLSALAGVAAVAATAGLARESSGRAAERWAAAFAALAPFQVQYAQEARPYALLAAFTIASAWALAVWRRRGGAGWLAAYVACGAGAAWTHNAWWFAWPALAAWSLFAPAGTPKRRGAALAAQAAILAASAPWLLSLGSKMAHVAAYRVPPATPVALAKALWGWGGSLPAVIGLALLVALALLAFRRADAESRRAMLLPAGIALCGVLVPFVYSLVRPPLFVPRAPLAPALAVLARAGAAAASARPRALALAAALLLVAGGAVRTARLVPERNKEPWREAVRDVERAAKPGDLVVVCAGYCLTNAWDWYRTRDDLDLLAVPRAGETLEAEERDGLSGALARHARSWLVLSHAGTNDTPVRQMFESRAGAVSDSLYWCEPIELTGYPRWVGIEVLRFESRAR